MTSGLRSYHNHGLTYRDLIINYNNIIYKNKNGVEVIRYKIITLNKAVNRNFRLENKYNYT